MEAIAQFIAEYFEMGFWGRQIVFTLVIAVVALVVFMVALVIAALITYVERRVAGRVQSRIGPNRVGPLGLLQWLADGAKMILKEDVIPAKADRPLFRLAPYLVMTGVFAAFASVPFGQLVIGADLNVGVLYLLAIPSLVVVGVLMAGWASNNKWSLLGGVRAAAQIVSYEIPSALSIMVVVLLSGTLSTQGIIEAQGGWPWEWYIFHNPFTFIAFFMYFTSAVAEGNRTPFDLPEAESELVSGYNTEYSGIRFGGFFLGEFANVYLMSAIATLLFFGGWQIPMVSPAEQADSVWLQLLGVGIFVAKASLGCTIVVLLRWTFPRLRVDQLMNLCYRYLVPISFLCLLGTAVYMMLVTAGSLTDQLVHLGTTGFAALLGVIFIWRVFFHIRHAKAPLDFNVLARGKVSRYQPGLHIRAYGAHRRQKAKGVR